MGRDYSVRKSRGLKEGQIDSGRYELPVPDKNKTCKRQNKKSWQHNGHLNKWMEWKGAASVHGRIKVGIAWDTIRRAQCDNRNAGHKKADEDNQDEMFFSDFHKLLSIVSTLFRNLFKMPPFKVCAYLPKLHIRLSCCTRDSFFKSLSFLPTLWYKSKGFI